MPPLVLQLTAKKSGKLAEKIKLKETNYFKKMSEQKRDKNTCLKVLKNQEKATFNIHMTLINPTEGFWELADLLKLLSASVF